MNRLKELRQKKGLTLIQLSEILGIDYSTIGHIERGRRGFSTESLSRACDYFGVSTDYMLGKSAEEMFNDFVDSMQHDFPESIPEPTRTKVDLLCVIRDLDDVSFLRAFYPLLKAATAKKDFGEPDEVSVWLSSISVILSLLPSLSNDALEVIKQTAVLHKEAKK